MKTPLTTFQPTQEIKPQDRKIDFNHFTHIETFTSFKT